jgi:hypothetical protein
MMVYDVGSAREKAIVNSFCITIEVDSEIESPKEAVW